MTANVPGAVHARRGKRFEDDKPTIALYFERNKNANLVVFDMKSVSSPENGGAKLAAEPVDAYWLDLEPSYMAKSRAKGKTDNREELNFIDRWQAYGAKAKEVKAHDAVLEFVALPKKVLTLHLEKDTETGNWVPIVRGKIGDTDNCIIERIYVQADEQAWIPSVLHIDMHGLHPDTLAPITERIKP